MARAFMFRGLIAVVLITSVACNSFANSVTVESYMKEKREDFKNFNMVWLDGVYEGLLTASEDMASHDKGHLFWPPERMTMTMDQIKSILDGYLATHKVQMSWPTDVLLLGALKATFPRP
jgi:hypothetical protein